jgi:hypothetical protein
MRTAGGGDVWRFIVGAVFAVLATLGTGEKNVARSAGIQPE